MELFSLLAKLTLDSADFEKGISQAENDLKDIDVPDTKLELDNSDFNDSIADSQGMGDTFGTEMTGVFNGIKTALTTTGIVAAIAGIVNGLKEAVNLTAETADHIDKGSKKLGISTKAYQEWDHALKQSGSSIDVVKKGIMQFQAAIKAADPATPFADAEDQVDGLADKTAGLSQDAYEAMRDLGLLSRLQAGEFKNAEELMNASLLALAGYEGSTDDRGILVRKLFGRGGDELNALLDEGEEGVKSLLTEASDLGLIMSEDEITQAVAYGDAVANLNAELDAIKTAFVEDIIPVLTDAVGWLTDFLKKLNPRLQTNSVFTVFEKINTKTLAANKQIDEATVEAGDLITKLQEMGNYWTLDEEGKMTWDALASRALELFPQLSEYIDKDGKKINGNTLEILNNVKAWALLEKQRLLSSAMEEKQAAIADQLTKAYEKGAEARKKESEAEGKRLTAIKELNKYREKYGLDDIDFSANSQQIAQAQEEILAADNGKTSILSFQLSQITSDFNSTRGEAYALREESEKMKDEANKAKESLADEQKYLMQEMGYTEEEIEAVTKGIDAYIRKLSEVPSDVTTTFHTEYDDRGYDHSYAIGSSYIPYDQMAMLHRGEKVLTATEARQGTGEIDYGHLEDRIAAAIRAGMDGATVRSYLNGRDITEEVNRNNIRDVKGRRFSG